MARYRTDLDTLINMADRYNRMVDNGEITVDDAMSIANERLALYGVEGLTYTCSVYPNVLYCNNGDPYDPTLVYDYDTAEFSVGGWGDYLEEHEAECEYCNGSDDDDSDGEIWGDEDDADY